MLAEPEQAHDYNSESKRNDAFGFRASARFIPGEVSLRFVGCIAHVLPAFHSSTLFLFEYANSASRVPLRRKFERYDWSMRQCSRDSPSTEALRPRPKHERPGRV